MDRGFTVLHVNDSLARGPSLLGQASWDGQLPHLEEVTRRNLEYDLQDTQKLKASPSVVQAGSGSLDFTACSLVVPQ